MKLLKIAAALGAVACLAACTKGDVQSAASKAAQARDVLCDDKWISLEELLARPLPQR